MFLKYFVVIVIFTVHLHGLDYCDKNLCQKGKHIACNPRKTFKSSCPDGIRLVSMNTDMQNIFLNHHNSVRDLVAGGKHPRGFDRATRMCSMVSGCFSYIERSCSFKICHVVRKQRDTRDTLSLNFFNSPSIHTPLLRILKLIFRYGTQPLHTLQH